MYIDFNHIILIAIGAVLLFASQSLVSSKYKKFRNIKINKSITGYEVAKLILASNNLDNVTIERVDSGTLSDYYDPKNNSVHLSPSVYDEDSVVSVAVAAHEVGHAIQHAKAYSFIALRNKILPMAIVGGNLGWFAIAISFINGLDFLFYIGLVGLILIALFQLLTLPIEFDASKRAIVQLTQLGIVDEDERADVKEMLTAAALTYVAALINSIIQILRAVLLRSSRKD